jgi:hypothetical protein
MIDDLHKTHDKGISYLQKPSKKREDLLVLEKDVQQELDRWKQTEEGCQRKAQNSK